MNAPRIDWVVLTTGDRPVELARALNSLAGGLAAEDRVHLVLNGPDLDPPAASSLAADVAGALHVIHAGENLGIPGGRNLGAGIGSAGVERAATVEAVQNSAVTGGADVIAFLDDDAVVVGAGALCADLRARFGSDQRLGGVSFRIVDPTTGATAQRHVPRPGGAGLDREGPVTSFLGGASALSGPMFRQVGGYEAAFFYAHEESDLAWRAIGQGWSFVYAPSLVVTHPMLPTTRHPGAIERSMRNRVWLVRRNLPLPVALVHLVVWVAIGLTRSRSAAGAASLLRGLRTGLGPCPRPPVPVGTSQRWRTTWRLTRAGRPPIL